MVVTPGIGGRTGWRTVGLAEPLPGAEVVQAANALEEAGAHVEEVAFRLPRDQRELSDLLFRLLIPANVQAIETLKAMGVDLVGEQEQPGQPEPQSV